MDYETREAGPRFAFIVSADDDLEAIHKGLTDAGYERHGGGQPGEHRFRHPDGSTVRCFEAAGSTRPAHHVYVYPPGGTKDGHGPPRPFSPFKRTFNAAATEAAASDEGNPDADGDGAADGTGDTSASDSLE